MFNDAFEKKYGYKPEWGAENAYISFAHWARMVEEAGTFYPPDVIKTYEKGETLLRWSATYTIAPKTISASALSSSSGARWRRT